MEKCPNGCTLRTPIAVTIQGVYDGGLFWHCDVCELSWHRWGTGYMRAKAQPYIDAWNRKRGHGGR